MTEYRPSVVNLVGSVLDDRYVLAEILGEGEMGAVYRAEPTDGGPQVAIKVLHEELGHDASLRTRFEREVKALFALSHPHVIGVQGYGIHEGNPYLVMELLEGRSLDAYVEARGRLNIGEAVEVGKQLLRGLAFAHSKGVLHRDLKTENIFVTRGPRGPTAKLLDFGLVKFVDDDRWGRSRKLTIAGSVFGTPAYMAPEQCSGEAASAQSDVYAAGVILFELFTGVWPFMEETRMDMFTAHLTRPPPTLSEARGEPVPAVIEAIVARALAKRPADRYADAGAMLAELEAAPLPQAHKPGLVAAIVFVAAAAAAALALTRLL